MSGGVDIVAPDGSAVDFLETGDVPLDRIFHGGDPYITDFGDITEVTSDAPMEGRLWCASVEAEGMPLFRGAISKGLSSNGTG